MANKVTVLIDVTVDRANRALTDFKTSVKSADGAVGKFKAGATSAMNSLKANAGQLAAVGGAAFVAFAAKGIKAASDLEESMNAVDVTFGDAADGIHKLGATSVESFGLSERAFNEAAVAFAAFAKQVAGPGGDVAGTMDDLITRAADFASVMNIDLSEAISLFQSTLAGETEPIRKYGKDVSAAAVEHYALANGLISSKSEMTEAIKVQARYGLLMQETADTAGDFENTSGSLANSQKILAAQVEDLSASVGKHLTPALAEATTNLNDMLAAADKMGLIDLAFAIQKAGDATFYLRRGVDLAQGRTDAFGKTVTNVTDAQIEFVRQAKEMGLSGEEVNAALASGVETIDEYNQMIDDNTVALGKAVGVAVGYTDSVEESEEAAKDAAEAERIHAEALDRAAAAASHTGREIDGVTSRFANMRRELSDRSGYLTAQEGIAQLATKQKQGADITEQEIIRMKNDVLDYGDTLTTVADKERIAKVTTDLDDGSYWAAAIALEQLEKTRTARVNIRTVLIGGQGGRRFNFEGDPRSHTGSRFEAGETKHVVPGQVFTPDVPGRLSSVEESNRMTSARNGGSTVNVTINADGGNGRDIARALDSALWRAV